MKRVALNENDPKVLAKNLIEVAKGITEQDKLKYLLEFRGSLSSVNRYLKGEIHNIPVAVVMLQYFRECAKVNNAQAKARA